MINVHYPLFYGRFREALLLLVAVVAAGCSSTGGVSTGGRVDPIEHQLMAAIALERGEQLVAVQESLSLAQKSPDSEYARRATELAFDYGFDAYALSSAERWVRLEPESRTAHGYLGRLYVMRNSLDAAWESLSFSLGAPEERTDADYISLSGDLSEIAAPARGLEVFLRFDEQQPGMPGITASIASLAAESGDLELAVSSARRTLALAPEWVATRVMLARFLLASGQSMGAFEQMAFAQEMHPGLEMELEFIHLVALAGEFEDALERLERMEGRYPDNPDLRRSRALVQLQSGDYASAQVSFMALLTDAYFVNECFWYLGQIAYQSGDYLQAIRYFDRVTAGGWVVPARLSTSQSYLALGQPDQALRVQEEFAAAYPKQVYATLQPRAEILASQGRNQQAQEIIALALEYKPWDAELWMYKGGLEEQAGQQAMAVKSFRRAVELAPQNPTALNALGYTLTVAGEDYEQAATYIRQALDMEPDNPAFMDSLGWVLFKQGEREEARVWLENAYAALPDPEIAAHLGELLWRQGEETAATEIWQEAAASNPGNRALQQTMERFLQ